MQFVVVPIIVIIPTINVFLGDGGEIVEIAAATVGAEATVVTTSPIISGNSISTNNNNNDANINNNNNLIPLQNQIHHSVLGHHGGSHIGKGKCFQIHTRRAFHI